VPNEYLEWAVRLALEARRRVEQQKRIVAAEFRNTHFSYQLGKEGRKVRSYPGTTKRNSIGSDPLNQGWWTISPEEWTSLLDPYRIEVNKVQAPSRF